MLNSSGHTSLDTYNSVLVKLADFRGKISSDSRGYLEAKFQQLHEDVASIASQLTYTRCQTLLSLFTAPLDNDLNGRNIPMVCASLQDNTLTMQSLAFQDMLFSVLISTGIDRNQGAHQAFEALHLQNKLEVTQGGLIARFQNINALRAYLAIETKLIENGVSADNALAHLSHIPKDDQSGLSEGMVIAVYQKEEARRAYCQYLMVLLDKGASIHHMLAHLNQHTDTGTTLGMLIAQSRYSAAIQTYMQLLIKLLDKGAAADRILADLNQQHDAGFTMGMMIADSQGAAAMDLYIRFLIKLLHKDASVDDLMIHLMNLKDEDGLSLWGVIENEQLASIDTYLDLVINLSLRGASKNKLSELLEGPLKYLNDHQSQYQADIIKLFDLGLLDVGKHFTPGKELKQAVLARIMANNNLDARKQALNDAAGKGELGLDHPVYKLVSCARIVGTSTSKNSGTLKQIYDALAAEEVGTVTIVAAPFPPVPMRLFNHDAAIALVSRSESPASMSDEIPMKSFS